MDKLQEEIGRWSESVYGKQTVEATLVSLEKEFHELKDTIVYPFYYKENDMQYEAADVLILLLSLAHAKGFSLHKALKEKMAINNKRSLGRNAVMAKIQSEE